MLALLLAAATPAFDPLRFFAGATEGRGRLAIVFHRARGVRVHGAGRVEPDGTLVLDQRVEQEGRPATTRAWRIRAVAPGRYAGTLTDATGPVTGEADGPRLHLRFRAAHGIRVDQWLLLAPDGRSAQNRLTARKFGLVVARLDERISRVD